MALAPHLTDSDTPLDAPPASGGEDEVLFDDEPLFDDDLLLDDDAGEPHDIVEAINLNGVVDDALSALDSLLAEQEPVVSAYDKEALVRRDVWHGLVHCIVSNAKLWSTVDVTEVKVLMEGSIAVLPQGPLILEPLWRYMIAKGTPRRAAAETLLFFHSRAARWNVTMILPAAMEELQEETRTTVAEKLSARGVTTGTHVGLAPVDPSAHKHKAATKKRLGSPKVGNGGAVRRVLLRIGVMAATGAAAFVAMTLSAPEDVSARAAAALGPVCAHARQQGAAILCTTDAITLATTAPLHERRAIAETALDVTIVFVDAEGVPLPLPPAR